MQQRPQPEFEQDSEQWVYLHWETSQNEEYLAPEASSDTTENSVLTSSRKRERRGTASSVEESRQLEIDLRAEGVSQDAILKDEEQMKKINKTLEKLKSGSCPKSTSGWSGKKPDNTTFSEESRRVIQEMGNMELFELG